MTTLKHRFAQDSITEIGLDEAGRGSFWGPIMAGAVILPDEASWTEAQRALFSVLRDSKKLTLLKRQKIEKEMQYPGQIKVTVIREMRAVNFAK